MVIGAFRKVIGVDILPFKHPLRGEPAFALTILEDGIVKKRIEEASLSKLLKVVKKEKPEVLALDNIFELASNVSKLLRVFNSLPPSTKVVQVTKLADTDIPLEVLANKHGLANGNKLSPLEASEVIAKLAYMGIGSIVSLFEEETRIIVAKCRSLGQGGMSSNRYERNISGLILRATRKVEEALSKHGIDYDLFFKKGSYGLTGSLFIVYAPREKLYGIVKQAKGHDLKILIRPVPKKNIEYIPLRGGKKVALKAARRNYLIVGVDPGIETGLAVLTILGKPLLLASARGISRNQIIERVTNYGVPLVIATDVNPPSLYVKKLASSLNSVLYVPPRDLSIVEKRKIVREFIEREGRGIKVINSHQRDALAAALKAFYAIKEKIERVREELSKAKLNIPLQEVIALVIKGKTVREALEELGKEERKKRRVIQIKGGKEEAYEEELKRKVRIIEELRRRNRILLEELRNKEDEIKKLKITLERELSKREHLRKENALVALEERVRELSKEVASLRKENEELRDKLRSWREVALKVAEGELLCLKVMDVLTPSRLLTFSIRIKEGANIIAVKELTTLNETLMDRLIKSGIKAIIVLTHIAKDIEELLAENMIAVIRVKELKYEDMDGYLLVSRETLDRALRAKTELMELRREARLREQLKEVIYKYRERRVKELSS